MANPDVGAIRDKLEDGGEGGGERFGAGSGFRAVGEEEREVAMVGEDVVLDVGFDVEGSDV